MRTSFEYDPASNTSVNSRSRTWGWTAEGYNVYKATNTKTTTVTFTSTNGRRLRPRPGQHPQYTMTLLTGAASRKDDVLDDHGQLGPLPQGPLWVRQLLRDERRGPDGAPQTP